jgi:hypothetical protein
LNRQLANVFLVFSADGAQEKVKKGEKVLQPAGVSKSAAHTVIINVTPKLDLCYPCAQKKFGSFNVFWTLLILLLDYKNVKNIKTFRILLGHQYSIL